MTEKTEDKTRVEEKPAEQVKQTEAPVKVEKSLPSPAPSQKKPEAETSKPKKQKPLPTPKKEEATAKGLALHISKKHAVYICRFIKDKPIDKAISDLQAVLKYKKAVPFKGEVPHRKGKGMMSGRYPINASILFINLLKSLKGNVLVNNMDLEKTRIKIASPSWAARPLRRGSRQGKRTNVLLIAREITQEQKEAKK